LVCGPDDKVGLVCCQPAAISELLQEVMRPAAISSKQADICSSVTNGLNTFKFAQRLAIPRILAT
jgi:hypothetical protein